MRCSRRRAARMRRSTKLGQLRTESPFVASRFVDRLIMFRHVRDPDGPFDARLLRLGIAAALGFAGLAAAAWKLRQSVYWG